MPSKWFELAEAMELMKECIDKVKFDKPDGIFYITGDDEDPTFFDKYDELLQLIKEFGWAVSCTDEYDVVDGLRF